MNNNNNNNTRLELIKTDFKNCLYVIWKHLGLTEPTPIQYEIADYLQYGSKRKMIEAFRGVGKSWITSAYVLWKLLNDPDYKILVVSASKQRSDDFVSFTKRLIHEMSIFNYLKAKPHQRDTMIAFDVGPCKAAHAPSVKAAGIFGQLAGSRATEIIGDDIEVPNNSATEDAREKLDKASREFEAIIVPGGKITFLGTPQTEESVYNTLPERGYEVRIWPARYPSSEKGFENYKGNLAPTIIEALETGKVKSGQPTDPDRFNELDLQEREASWGKAGWMLQFMLDTELSDAEKYPLKLNDLIVHSCHDTKAPILIQYGSGPLQTIKGVSNVGFTGDRLNRPLYVDDKWAEYEGSMMFIDPAGRGLDETGYVVIKHLHGVLYITRAGGFKGGYDDITLESLAKIAKEQKVNDVIVESNFGDGMFLQLFLPVLKKHHKCNLEEYKVKGQKERRIIDTIEPVMNRHKLVIDLDVVKEDVKQAQVDRRYSLLYQMTRITYDRGALKHDDRLDALAGAIAYWVDSMSRDELEAVDDYKQALLDKELDNFINNCINIGEASTYNNNGDRWFDIH